MSVVTDFTRYARAALPLVPGASRLPWVAGGGGEMPALEREAHVEPDPERLATFARVCEFPLRDAVPPTWPHIMAFGLHMSIMGDGSFPFAPVGLVHIANRIEQRRPIATGEALELRAHATPVEPHPRGQAFALVTEAAVDGEVVWSETSTNLRRGGGSTEGAVPAGGGRSDRPPSDRKGPAADEGDQPATEQTWSLPSDVGRRYGGVSGDLNPIHLSDLTAKAFGFPRAIAHGMWTKARCLAALQDRLPDAFAVDVQFRKPILLPATVAFAQAPSGEAISFSVRESAKGTPHLDGNVEPLA
jgi:acyl dehydratase